jgi:hypothetical protein
MPDILSIPFLIGLPLGVLLGRVIISIYRNLTWKSRLTILHVPKNTYTPLKSSSGRNGPTGRVS